MSLQIIEYKGYRITFNPYRNTFFVEKVGVFSKLKDVYRAIDNFLKAQAPGVKNG